MSFYNMLFGQNILSKYLLKILDIDQDNSKWESGRFRDIYLDSKGEKIILLTRNGGGNRESYFPDEIRNHPDYLCDYDDDFDCTYAYIEFSIPQGHEKDCKNFLGLHPHHLPTNL